MKIENLRSEKKGSNVRSVATVVWEDCDYPSQDVYFETGEAFAQDLSLNPHAFLLACIMPAFRHGEKRVCLNAEVCPELKDGLMTAMAWMRQWYDWYDSDRNLVKIEAKTMRSVPTSSKPKRTGFFFSGGIDSLATLRVNRLTYPIEHPGSINDGLLIGGLEVNEREVFEQVASSLSDVAKDADITLIPIYTNLRTLDDDWDFWAYEFQGAALSAVAHALAKRLSLVYIAASDDISSMLPLGSHPLIDPLYTSIDLRVKHDGITLSRFAKTELVANWDLGLQNVRVCTKSEKYQPDMLNCGECEKCVRTMLALLALGVLERSGAFPKNNVSEELVLRCANITPDLQAYYHEMIPPLLKGGRSDLVHAINQGIARYYKRKWKKNWKSRMINPIVEFDRRYLAGKLKQIKQLMFTHETK